MALILQPAELLQAALDYAARRWRVFPCNPADKRPLVDNGLHDATTDTDQIRALWREWPMAMIAIHTGTESGAWALDLDVDVNKGLNGIGAFRQRFGDQPLPETFRVKTPRGGEHSYFAWHDGIKNGAGRLGPGVDIRGQDGYTILPPSMRSDRVCYETLCNVYPNLPPAPDWLIEAILAAQAKIGKADTDDADRNSDSHQHHVTRARLPHGNGKGYAAAALEDELGRIASAPVGKRNHTLNVAAFSLGQLVGAGALDENMVRDRLTGAASGLAADDGANSVENTISSGLSAGMAQPRQIPQRQREVVRDKENNTPPAPLQFLDLAKWQAVPPPPRAWAVRDRIPLNNVTLISGEGATGKSILSLQLAVAGVLARDWIGSMPEPGPVLGFYAEDDADELHRRLDAILAHYGASYADVAAELHLMSLAGQDALLATPRRDGLLEATTLMAQLRQAACDIKPKLIVVDNSADVFGGNENDRAQVRQFIGMLRGLAMAGSAGLLLTSHPSLTGISSGTGLSGSTAWNASVRSRLYLKRATTAKDEEPDPNLRVLEVMKSNYGPIGETITLRWKDGLFLPVAAPGSLEKLAREQKIDELFLTLVNRWNGQGRTVSDKKKANNYAPTCFTNEPEAKADKITKKELESAMARLFAADKIRCEPYGPACRDRSKLVRK